MSKRGEGEETSLEEEKEDAISEVVKSVYRVVYFRPVSSLLLPFILTQRKMCSMCRGPV